MIRGREFENGEGGVRLDAALLRFAPGSTRAFVREAIEAGRVRVDGRRAAKGLKLRGGEKIEVEELLEAEDNLVRPEPPNGRGGISPNPSGGIVSSLFCDSSLLAFDKPAGMAVQPLTCRETGTLMNAVVAAYPECRELGRELAKIGENPLMAGALHRIDADTSGLVLVARTLDAFVKLREQFAKQTVKKTYLALVEGEVRTDGERSPRTPPVDVSPLCPAPRTLPVDVSPLCPAPRTPPADWSILVNDLVHDPTLPFCRMIDAHHNRLTRAQCARLRPLHAVTQYRPIGCTTIENEVRTLLEVTIYTGVTHQIRAQLALAGLHIVNDRLYGAFAVENQVGHCLHALAASFVHPVTGEPCEIRTPPPAWSKI